MNAGGDHDGAAQRPGERLRERSGERFLAVRRKRDDRARDPDATVAT